MKFALRFILVLSLILAGVLMPAKGIAGPLKVYEDPDNDGNYTKIASYDLSFEEALRAFMDAGGAPAQGYPGELILNYKDMPGVYFDQPQSWKGFLEFLERSYGPSGLQNKMQLCDDIVAVFPSTLTWSCVGLPCVPLQSTCVGKFTNAHASFVCINNPPCATGTACLKIAALLNITAFTTVGGTACRCNPSDICETGTGTPSGRGIIFDNDVCECRSNSVPAPPGGWKSCAGCYIYAHWTGQGYPAEWDCNYDACATGHCEASHDSTMIAVAGNTVTVKLGNYFIAGNRKSVYIRVRGSGGLNLNPPNTAVIQGIGYSPNPNSAVEYLSPVYNVDALGNWFVDIHAGINPQPDKVLLTFNVPGTPVVTEAWASECCTEKNIPTLSEWGLIIFALLILTLISVVVVRRKTVLATAGGDASMTIGGPLFIPVVFWKTLTVMLVLAGAGLGVAMAIAGTVAVRDIAGTIVSAGIVAYIAHLWIGTRKE